MNRRVKKILKEITKFIFVICLGFSFTHFLVSQESNNASLWQDKDPYSSSQIVRNGDVLNVLFKEPLKVEYEAKYKADSDHKIMSNPDKKMIPEIKGYESDQSIARNTFTKSKTSGKILGSIAVRVIGQDPGTGLLEIEGRRETQFDNDRQILGIKGFVSKKDIEVGRSIEYSRIANLTINYSAHPTPRNLQNPEIGLKEIRGEDGTVTYSSELSDTEKQELLLKYMKRLLGESGEEGSR
jgi:flagellar L-ring protein FlgH